MNNLWLFQAVIMYQRQGNINALSVLGPLPEKLFLEVHTFSPSNLEYWFDLIIVVPAAKFKLLCYYTKCN